MSWETPTRCPLAWPEGWKITPAHERERARFSTKSRNDFARELSVSQAVDRVRHELELMGVDIWNDLIISTDLKVRLDGLPRSDQRAPENPGACAYWVTKAGERRCMAIDRYDRVADNIAAIAATLNAMRAIERHGGAAILERAFTAFTALPSPAQWWHVLGFDSTKGLTYEDVRQRYRELAMQRHPDRDGGTDDAMAELSWARDKAREHFGVNE